MLILNGDLKLENGKKDLSLSDKSGFKIPQSYPNEDHNIPLSDLGLCTEET